MILRTLIAVGLGLIAFATIKLCALMALAKWCDAEERRMAHHVLRPLPRWVNVVRWVYRL